MRKQCAEAIVEIQDEVVLKTRISKGYRIKEIDERLRRERTRKEARIISEARKKGVPTPIVFDVDDYVITMERIKDPTVRDIFNDEGIPLDEKGRICEKIGEYVGRLHNAGIIHGDLTTSNMILSDEKIYLIDFGLSFFDSSVEARGIDVHVFFQSLRGTHDSHELLEKAFSIGYSRTFEKADEVLERVKVIESRGRYRERERQLFCEK